MLGLTFSSKFDCISISKKTGALIRSMKFPSPKLLYISRNLSYGHAWNTLVISVLVLLPYFL